MGQIRAVLWQHLHAHAPHVPAAPQVDPNDLLDAEGFVAALQELRLQGGDRALREAGASYAALWARTFRTLVKHLRGHPGHTLRVWSEEVYPFLRGDRLAARAEAHAPHIFDVVVHRDLPGEYLAGFLQAFIELSHAEADVEVRGDTLRVHYRVKPTERVVRLVYVLAQLRVPLLLTSLLAALVGTMLAWRHGFPAPWWLVVAVLWGTVSAQSGANAFHDLSGRPRPLTAPGPTRGWLLFQAIGSYAVAAAAMGIIIWSGRPGIVVYAVAGLLLGLMYRSLRDEGWGPFIAALSHGPLTVWGSFHAFAGPIILTPVPAIILAMPTGLLAAAILYLDDLADRPLDEAAGKRTLVVRLPRRRHVALLAILLAAALGALAIVLAWEGTAWVAGAAVLAIVAGILIQTVRRNIDDPSGLAPARMGILGLFVAAVALLLAAQTGGMA